MKVPWISSLLVFLLAAGVTFVAVYVNASRSGSSLAAPRFVQKVFSDPGLGLRVESQGEHLSVTWDLRSPTVRSAVSGILSIDDGGQHRSFQLDAAQVTAGSVLYKPASDDVTFRLELRNDRGTPTVESMRVLGSTKPSSSTAPATQPQSNPPPLQSNPPAHENPTEPLDRKVRVTRGRRSTYVPPATPPSAPATGTNTPATAPPDGKTLSTFKPARALRQVMPDAASFASEVLYKPTRVEVSVTINASGRVTSARIVRSGNPALAGAALTAARQWVFEPATWHGKPVEGRHTIVFTFQATGR